MEWRYKVNGEKFVEWLDGYLIMVAELRKFDPGTELAPSQQYSGNYTIVAIQVPEKPRPVYIDIKNRVILELPLHRSFRVKVLYGYMPAWVPLGIKPHIVGALFELYFRPAEQGNIHITIVGLIDNLLPFYTEIIENLEWYLPNCQLMDDEDQQGVKVNRTKEQNHTENKGYKEPRSIDHKLYITLIRWRLTKRPERTKTNLVKSVFKGKISYSTWQESCEVDWSTHEQICEDLGVRNMYEAWKKETGLDEQFEK